MTTIGYGSWTPSTSGGKSFTVVFGMISIAIMGSSLRKCSNRSHKRMSKGASLGYNRQIRIPGLGLKTPKGCVTTLFWAAVTGTYALCFAGVLISCNFSSTIDPRTRDSSIGTVAGTQEHTADWGWGNTVYFVLISFMSVGFGDFALDVPGPGDDFVLVTGIFVGLVLVANVIQSGTYTVLVHLGSKSAKDMARDVTSAGAAAGRKEERNASLAGLRDLDFSANRTPSTAAPLDARQTSTLDSQNLNAEDERFGMQGFHGVDAGIQDAQHELARQRTLRGRERNGYTEDPNFRQESTWSNGMPKRPSGNHAGRGQNGPTPILRLSRPINRVQHRAYQNIANPGEAKGYVNHEVSS